MGCFLRRLSAVINFNKMECGTLFAGKYMF